MGCQRLLYFRASDGQGWSETQVNGDDCVRATQTVMIGLERGIGFVWAHYTASMSFCEVLRR